MILHYWYVSYVSWTGQVSTYQLGKDNLWGASYKITPETTEVELNVMKCFQVNGTKDEVVTPQGSLPDAQHFQVCVRRSPRAALKQFQMFKASQLLLIVTM